MIKAILKNTVIISSLGHLAVFGLFSFSFDQRKVSPPEPALVFWGQILPDAALDFRGPAPGQGLKISSRPEKALPETRTGEPALSPDTSLKPQVEYAFDPGKPVFVPENIIPDLPSARKDSPIMFHPLLPYQLQLYFKDRQAVHIELMFNISSAAGKNLIMIRRKISSGNLEADLLSQRYINHYLFIQQSRFARDSWQTVKIDLSSKND